MAKKKRVSVPLDAFMKLAFQDENIKTHLDIAEETKMAVGSVTAKIARIRKNLIESGVDPEGLRTLPQKPKKTRTSILEAYQNAGINAGPDPDDGAEAQIAEAADLGPDVPF